MLGPGFFSLHSLSFCIRFFPKINPYYYFTSLHGLQDVENHCAQLRDIELISGRKLPCLRFPLYYSLYSWIEEHETTKLKKKILWILKKDTKTSTKRHGWNGMTQKWTFWYLQQCACVNAIYFAAVVTTTCRVKNNKMSTRGQSLEVSVLARARAKLLNMLYISRYLSLSHGENT